MTIITISRQPGSYGDEIGQSLASKLGWLYLDRAAVLRQFIEPWATPAELKQLTVSPRYYLQESSNHITFLEYLDGALHELADRQNLVLVGFGASFLFDGYEDALHIRCYADEATRLRRYREETGRNPSAAKQEMLLLERKYRRFTSVVFGRQNDQPDDYHLLINTALTSPDAAIAVIEALLDDHLTRRRLLESAADSQAAYVMDDFPDMKNQSEIEFARILDMYQIDWRYEPKTFPIEWDADGQVTLAFSPDFYLPKFNLYLELTTMNQKYVTMKNKKARKLQELYPGVQVRIVYRKDFLSLLERFDALDS